MVAWLLEISSAFDTEISNPTVRTRLYNLLFLIVPKIGTTQGRTTHPPTFGILPEVGNKNKSTKDQTNLF